MSAFKYFSISHLLILLSYVDFLNNPFYTVLTDPARLSIQKGEQK
nr:MAG TPA: hypothetical protein [Caudoviricetes sp.]